MSKNLIIGILLGAGALALYYSIKNKKDDESTNDEMSVDDKNEVVEQAKNEQKSKFTNAFLTQYNIKMPPIQASKVVKDNALKMQNKRYSKQIKSQLSQPKVYL
jgi:hypothetical protein